MHGKCQGHGSPVQNARTEAWARTAQGRFFEDRICILQGVLLFQQMLLFQQPLPFQILGFGRSRVFALDREPIQYPHHSKHHQEIPPPQYIAAGPCFNGILSPVRIGTGELR
jgi:hypothetical protein